MCGASWPEHQRAHPAEFDRPFGHFYDPSPLPRKNAESEQSGDHMAGNNVVEITDQNFEQEVLTSSVPVLVDFWAEWCLPCRMLAPTIDKLAKDYAGKLKVGKVDTEVNRDIAIKYSISAIPTVIL